MSSFLSNSFGFFIFFPQILTTWTKRLFEAEEQDLFSDLQSLPRNAALRKLNDLIKRARLAKVRMIHPQMETIKKKRDIDKQTNL